MTSIASTTSNYLSPRQLLQNELLSEVSSGTISSSDQSALSSALDDIDSSISADQSSQSSGSQKPGDIKSKIDDLISGEVSNGTLTSDQAAELQNIFKSAFANAPGGPGGPNGAGGPPPGPPPGASDQSASSTDSSSSGDSTSQLLQDFLKLIQDAQSSSYSANGTTASSSLAAQLLDYSA